MNDLKAEDLMNYSYFPEYPENAKYGKIIRIPKSEWVCHYCYSTVHEILDTPIGKITLSCISEGGIFTKTYCLLGIIGDTFCDPDECKSYHG